jgi:two-component system nitrogen regulation response regulator GlnG
MDFDLLRAEVHLHRFEVTVLGFWLRLLFLRGIGIDIVETELADATPAPSAEAVPADESLGAVVDRHLKTYFAAHKDGLPPAGVYDRIVREVERPLLSLTLIATRGNQIKAAQLLGLNRNTLRKKIRELDIQVVRGLK